jgi:hypothetical protein
MITNLTPKIDLTDKLLIVFELAQSDGRFFVLTNGITPFSRKWHIDNVQLT